MMFYLVEFYNTDFGNFFDKWKIGKSFKCQKKFKLDDVLNVKKHICSIVKDHNDNLCI